MNIKPTRKVVILFLCEQDRLLLKPQQLYYFIVSKDCPSCQKLEQQRKKKT